MKNCLTSLSQIKTTMKCLFTPTGMAKIKKKGSSIGEDVEKLEPSETVSGNLSWCSHFEEQSSSFSQMLKHRVAIWPSNSSFWQIPKRTENSHTEMSTWLFIAVLFITAKQWNYRRCPSADEWIESMWCISVLECYETLKRNEVLMHGIKWLNHENIKLSENNQFTKLALYSSTYIKHLE